ncbi:MAG: hypothetical protein F4Y64_03045 [Rhodothermaceae bacterium]|nr:hypothetical protein [Rhodothermaceae bacterium]MYJ07941.1 hypothetical protein [Rhodothermaceae bacterium]
MYPWEIPPIHHLNSVISVLHDPVLQNLEEREAVMDNTVVSLNGDPISRSPSEMHDSPLTPAPKGSQETGIT